MLMPMQCAWMQCNLCTRYTRMSCILCTLMSCTPVHAHYAHINAHKLMHTMHTNVMHTYAHLCHAHATHTPCTSMSYTLNHIHAVPCTLCSRMQCTKRTPMLTNAQTNAHDAHQCHAHLCLPMYAMHMRSKYIQHTFV